jgi:hypothetical protein
MPTAALRNFLFPLWLRLRSRRGSVWRSRRCVRGRRRRGWGSARSCSAMRWHPLGHGGSRHGLDQGVKFFHSLVARGERGLLMTAIIVLGALQLIFQCPQIIKRAHDKLARLARPHGGRRPLSRSRSDRQRRRPRCRSIRGLGGNVIRANRQNQTHSGRDQGHFFHIDFLINSEKLL